jgi:hypothetical protein
MVKRIKIVSFIFFFFFTPVLHLQHLASVKRSVSLQILDFFFQTIGRIPWTGDQPVVRPLPTHKTHKYTRAHTHTHTPNIHARSEIRTHDHSIRDSEHSSCFRPLGYRDRRSFIIYIHMYTSVLGYRRRTRIFHMNIQQNIRPNNLYVCLLRAIIRIY